MTPSARMPPKRLRHWLERIGVLGFAFFLVKGLLWLTVPALLAYWAGQ